VDFIRSIIDKLLLIENVDILAGFAIIKIITEIIGIYLFC